MNRVNNSIFTLKMFFYKDKNFEDNSNFDT